MSPYTTPTLPIVSAQNVVRPFAFAGVAPRRAAATVVMGDVIFAANAAPQYNTAARVYNRAVGGTPFPSLAGNAEQHHRRNGVYIPSFKIQEFFQWLAARARHSRLHRNLRADLDHAAGRNVEEVGGVARRFRQADEQPVLPARHRGMRGRLERAAR